MPPQVPLEPRYPQTPLLPRNKRVGIWSLRARKDAKPRRFSRIIRLPGKGDSNSHGARPVHQKHRWIRTSRLSIKNSLSLSRIARRLPWTWRRALLRNKRVGIMTVSCGRGSPVCLGHNGGRRGPAAAASPSSSCRRAMLLLPSNEPSWYLGSSGTGLPRSCETPSS